MRKYEKNKESLDAVNSELILQILLQFLVV